MVYRIHSVFLFEKMNTYTIFLFFILYSNVYSVSSKYSGEIPSATSLDREGIRELLNDQEAKAKWNHILSKNILYNKKYESLEEHIDTNDDSTEEIQYIDVFSVLQKYTEGEEMGKSVSINIIRYLIQDATNCTGLMNTNLYAMLILKDLLPYFNSCNSCNSETDEGDNTDIKNNVTCCAAVFDEYHMNFNVNTKQGKLELKALGDLQKNEGEMADTRESSIPKRAALDIVYRIHLGDINKIFNTSGTVKPIVMNLYEIISILIFTIRSTDEKLQETCVAHKDSFAKKYQFLIDKHGKKFAHIFKDMDVWGSFNKYFSESNHSSDETSKHSQGSGDKKEDYRRELAVITPYTPFLIQQADFTDENTTSSLYITKDEDSEENSRFMNATIRKLSFNTSFENDLDKKHSHKEDSNEKKLSDNYCFKGTVNVDLI